MRSNGLVLLVGGILFISIVAGGYYLVGMSNPLATQNVAPAEIKVGSSIPDFELSSLDNTEIHINQYLGKPVVVNFWATWCIPCKQEMPLLERYYQEQNDKLIVLGINNQEPADIARPFVLENQITFPILLDRQGKIRDQFLIRGFPTSLFIDAKGVFVAEHIGMLDEESLKSYLHLIGVKI